MAGLQRSVCVDTASDSTSQTVPTNLQRRASHSYIPYIPRRTSMVIRDRVAGASEINKDCIPIYPYIKEDGTKLMVSEYDFNVKMQKKYRALLGDIYIYPVLDPGKRPKIAKEELLEITKEDTRFLDYFIPHEVEVMIRGGIHTLKRDASDNLYMFGKQDNDIYEVKLKMVTCKEMKEFEAQQKTMADSSQFCAPTNTKDITADDVITQFIAGLHVPTVRRVKNVFGYCEGEVEILNKLREMGLLEKYEEEIDDEKYFQQFVKNKSRIFDVGFDYRRLKEEEKEYGFVLSENTSKKTFETEDKPSDTSFESEVDIEPFKLEGKSPYDTAPSCDSGLGFESPPTSPSSHSKSPTPCN